MAFEVFVRPIAQPHLQILFSAGLPDGAVEDVGTAGLVGDEVESARGGAEGGVEASGGQRTKSSDPKALLRVSLRSRCAALDGEDAEVGASIMQPEMAVELCILVCVLEPA